MPPIATNMDRRTVMAGSVAIGFVPGAFARPKRERRMYPQEISDRLEIEQLLVRYCYAVDDRDWPAYLRVFTPDARIDYSETGGPIGTPPEMAAFLRKALAKVKSAQHVISTTLLEINGDHATARTICQCPMVLDMGEGKEQVIFQGLWYEDELTRTADGWRIAKRYERNSYAYNVPPGFSWS